MSEEKPLPDGNSRSAMPPRKVKALEGLKQNMTFSQAAEYAGIDRATLWRWMTTDPVFIAGYNEWKESKLMAVEGILVGAGPAAARCLAKRARVDDVAAVQLLKIVDKYRRPRPGSTSASEVQQERKLAKEQRRIEREARKQKLLDQHLKTLYEKSKRERAVEQAMIARGITRPALPPAPAPKQLPPIAPAPAESTAPVESSFEPSGDVPAPPPDPNSADHQSAAVEATQRPEPPPAAAGDEGDEGDEDADTTEIC